MKIKVEQPIAGSREKIWNVITDIDNADITISAIEKIEVLEKPAKGLEGLKWRETRTLFGKTAVEVMWITEAVENQYYRTRAESHGSVYNTNLSISGSGNNHVLIMEFESQAQNFTGKLLAVIFGTMFKNTAKKAFVRDLQDIKKAVEMERVDS
jgi:hypothetical protein